MNRSNLQSFGRTFLTCAGKLRLWRYSRLRMGLLLIAAVAAVAWLAACAARKNPDFDEAAWRDRALAAQTEDLYAPNHDGKAFFNPWMPMPKKSFLTFLRWRLSPASSEYTEFERAYLPDVVPDPLVRLQALQGADFILWVGHGTFFMRINGEYWLTDPIFSQRALLPRRRTPPGLSLSQISTVIGTQRLHVIISHSHYDHLDVPSIRQLPDTARFYVSRGLKAFVEKQGKSDVTEMDWWQTLVLDNGITLVCLPNQHWSRRINQPINTTLWAGFLIKAPDLSIYFDGDGGYFIGYQEIGRRFPGIDYALIPTTAYQPRWFMHYAHMNIDEALAAFDDLGAAVFIPTQWGTFQLGDEPAGYPRLDLERTIVRRDLDPGRFVFLEIGEAHAISRSTQE